MVNENAGDRPVRVVGSPPTRQTGGYRTVSDVLSGQTHEFTVVFVHEFEISEGEDPWLVAANYLKDNEFNDSLRFRVTLSSDSTKWRLITEEFLSKTVEEGYRVV